MSTRGISIESIASWYAEAARNRREQYRRRRRGRHRQGEEATSPEPQQRDLLGLNQPGCLAVGAAESSAEVGHSGNTPDAGIVPELSPKGEDG